jgi:hypothetical protein
MKFKYFVVLKQDSTKKDLDQKDLKRIIRDLDLGNMDISLLKDLVILSSKNPVEDDGSLNGEDKMDDLWEGGALFRKLLASLFHQLTSDKVGSAASLSSTLLTRHRHSLKKFWNMA